MANAGAAPSGFNPSDVSYLQSALQSDAATSTVYNDPSTFTSANKWNDQVNDYSPKNDPNVWANEDAPARLTDIPTSSTDASRPRTVAAGYDPQRKVLTVMFRDGTLINYYEVESGTWENFHNSISKGRPWLNFHGAGTPGELVANHRYAPANLDNVDPSVLTDIYRVARSAQVRYATRSGSVNRNVSNGRGRYSYKPGKNPATAGTPHRKPRKP